MNKGEIPSDVPPYRDVFILVRTFREYLSLNMMKFRFLDSFIGLIWYNKRIYFSEEDHF